MAEDREGAGGGGAGAGGGTGSGSGERRRRPRYRGTHPRRFGERYKELQPERYPEMQTHVRARGRTPAGTHVPILVAEVLAALAPQPGDVVLDGTLGWGGHAEALLRRIGPEGRLVGLDRDGATLARTRARLEAAGFRLATYHCSFDALLGIAAAEGLAGFDVVLADLGVSSMQVDDPARGFSYKVDGPLDMRLDPGAGRTAADLLAGLPQWDLAASLRELSDEPDAEAIAAALVRERRRAPITRTAQLAALVLEAKGLDRRWRAQSGAGPGEVHPAARTFQTLRILVNDELGALDRLLQRAPRVLRPGGRIGVISFHSGEDRLVKRAFRDGLRGGVYEAVADEVIRPGRQEVRDNPRASAARFRWARRSAAPVAP